MLNKALYARSTHSCCWLCMYSGCKQQVSDEAPRSPIVTVRRAKVWVGVGPLEIGKGGDQHIFLQKRAPRLNQNPCDLLHDPLAGLAANKLEFDISDLRQLVPVGGHYEGTKYSL